MQEIIPMLFVSIISALICTGMLAVVHNFMVKRYRSDSSVVTVSCLTFVVTMIITMIPGIMFLDKVYGIMYNDSVTTLELPEVEHQPYRPWIYEFSEDDEHCLALNIYFEARGENNIRGKYAVADVVMYRFMHDDYPNSICEVVQDGYYYSWKPELPVKHKCQFSWWCDGKSDDPVDTNAFEEAIDIAKEVLHDSNYEPRVEFSLFYHATWVSPRWAKSLEFVETIGNHSFYKYKTGHVVP